MPFLAAPPTTAPKAIIFDIGRVIIPVDMSRSLANLSRLPAKTRSHADVLHQLQADPRWPDWQEGRITSAEWHAHLAERLQFSYPFEQFCAIWNSVLDPETLLPESLFEQLAQLCRLALLSNTDPIHVAHIEARYRFVRHFPVRVYSCRVGASKPGPEIYQCTLRELNAAPEETVFIDDMLENARAAAALGMHAFHFCGAPELLTEFSRLGFCPSLRYTT